MSDDEIEFVIEAVKMVASEGWKLLPRSVLYRGGDGGVSECSE